MTKRQYKAPAVTPYGNMQHITRAGQFAGTLDDNYPQNTPSTVGLFSP